MDGSMVILTKVDYPCQAVSSSQSYNKNVATKGDQLREFF